MPSSLCATSSASGRATLFLPGRFHKSSPTPVELADIPLLGFDEHPLPGPLRRSGLGYPRLQCKPLHEALLSIESGQVTMNKYDVLQNDPVNGLKRISICGVFLENLKVYVSSGIDLSTTNSDGLLFYDGSNRRFYITWIPCGSALIVPADEHLSSIYGALPWFNLQANHLIISCEIAVRDEGQHQILQLTNLQTQFRYLNAVADALKTNETWKWQYTPLNIATVVPTPELPLTPAWGRSTSAQHTAVIESRSSKAAQKSFDKTFTRQFKEERKSTTGFPDFLWPQSPRGGGYGGVGEVKCFWTASDLVISHPTTGGSTWKTQAPENSIDLAMKGLALCDTGRH